MQEPEKRKTGFFKRVGRFGVESAREGAKEAVKDVVKDVVKWIIIAVILAVLGYFGIHILSPDAPKKNTECSIF